ncbi:MAG: hypothetical protein CMN73_16460 [Sphingomonas sp.]|nr:hypothetical protein [Sphingomonas sp.]|tara:strand:- start:415 stop:927 length:513 start_codon:yes stop_codon:yes gene_type:complete
MAIEAPPSRYRVIERNRRLEVVDTWNHGRPPATPRSPIPRNLGEERRPRDAAPNPGRNAAWQAPRTRSSRVSPIGQDAEGRTLIRTAGWWDAKGPRTVTLRRNAVEEMQPLAALALVAAVVAIIVCLFQPWLFLVLGFALANSTIRERIRAGLAGVIDGVAQEATDASDG